MKKTEWPIRWDLLLRYRLIEIIALWEGRLTTNHICHGFGIGRQQASKDINMYLRELAPGNLEYDRHLKGYVPSANFRPVVTKGEADEYLDLVRRHEILSQAIEDLDIGLPNSTVLRFPRRLAEPEVVRTLIAATRQGRLVEGNYVSFDHVATEHCVLEPHTLICSGDAWYVRGWCHNRKDFRNFQVSRFRAPTRMLGERTRHGEHLDDDWNSQVTVTFRPDSRLNDHQQALVAHDYGMSDRQLQLSSRTALLPLLLQQAGLDGSGRAADPLTYPLELVGSQGARTATNTETSQRQPVTCP